MPNFLKIFCAVLLLWPLSAAAVDVVVIAPQEGEDSVFGRELAEGVKFAAADINAKGGVLGKRINVIVADDRCDDLFAVSMAQMLSVREDKASLVIGPYCRNEFAQTADIYARGGILQIVPVPLDGDTRQAPAAPLKIAGLRSEQGKAFFEYYNQNLPGQRVALAYDSTERGLTEVAAEIQRQFAQGAASEYLQTFDFFGFGNDFEQMAGEILRQNQVVYILGASKQAAKLTRELKKRQDNVKIFAERAAVDGVYEEITGKWSDGNYFLGLKSFKDSPYFTETLVRLRLQGQEPVGLGVYGFAALQLWAEIAAKAGRFDYTALKQTANGSFAMPWGAMSFKNGHFSGYNLYGVFERRGEEYAQVY